MVLWFYRLIFVPVLLVLAPLLWWRTRRRQGHRQAMANRLGAMPAMPPKLPGRRRVWLQAVSVGELLAVGPLLDELAGWPEVDVLLTTTTSTGFRLAQERYQGRVAAVAFFPVDFWPCTARAWSRVEADVLILTEGERWPEHIHQARKRGAPVVCINARLSDRSFSRLRSARALVPGLLGGMTRLLAVSTEDAERFRQLGFAADRIEVTGNIKLDTEIPLIDGPARAALRAELGFGPDDRVVLGASTWPGEEEALTAAWQRARAADPAWANLRLLLVPRHAERREQVLDGLRKAGVRHHLRSRGRAPGSMEACVADTTGELQRLVQLAEVVFVGKSLPPHTDGQTPVEAAGLGRAVIFGPGMSNFRAIARDLVERGAALRVADGEALASTLANLLADPGLRRRMGEAGQAWHRSNRGALARTVAVVRDLVYERAGS